MIKGRLSVAAGDTYSNVPNEGQTRTRIYKTFSRADALGRENVFRIAGYHTEVNLQGPLFTLRATQYQPSPQAPFYTDKWSWSKEIVSRSIWQHPKVIQDIELSGDPQDYRGDILDAINNGTEYDPSFGGALGSQVYRHLVNEEDSYEFEKLVVRRIRQSGVFRNGASSNAPNLQLNANAIIYRTADFINVFDVPPNLQAIMPFTPDDPSDDYAWGWRIRDQNGDFEGSIKFTETTDWVFAPWSLLAYELH